MGFFAKYLRSRPGKGGGVNIVKDPVQKKKFQAEIEAMVDPEQRAEQLMKREEELLLRSRREPTVNEVLTELARQAKRLRERRPNAPLTCFCGGYAFALLAQVRSYPETTLGLEIIMDKHVPPWDTVVLYRDGKGKKTGGIL